VVAENPLSGMREEVFDGEMVKNRRLPTSWEDAVNAVRNTGAPGVRDPDFRQDRRRDLSRCSLFRGAGAAPSDPHPDGLGRPLWRDLAGGLQGAGSQGQRGRDRQALEYAGPVEEFLPLLHIGQLTLAGKSAVFGPGCYRLRET
jgi:hypothetical protein